jgi:hypothetical protein
MNKNEDTTIVVTEQAPEAMYLITKAEIDGQVATARAFPRSIAAFYKKTEAMACVSEEVAASCTYAVPRDGKTIEGPTIRFAEIVAASYGNIRAAARIVLNDGKMITAQGICHDLENNTCVTVEVKRRITNKKGQTYSEDMQVTTGNAACSIALRNAIFRVVPTAMVDEIWEKTKVVARGTAATLEKRRNGAVAYFESLGVKREQIFAVLEVKGMEEIDLDKLAKLTGFKNAIKQDGIKPDTIFNPKAAEEKPEVDKVRERHEKLLFDCKTVPAVQELFVNNPTIDSTLVDKRIAEIEMGVGVTGATETKTEEEKK